MVRPPRRCLPLDNDECRREFLNDITIEFWPISSGECAGAVRHLLRACKTTPKSFVKIVKSSDFMKLILMSLDQSIYDSLIDGKNRVPFMDFMEYLGINAEEEPINTDVHDEITLMDLNAFVILCSAKTTGSKNIAKRLQTAHAMSGVEMPCLIQDLISFLMKVDSINQYNTEIWCNEDLAKSMIVKLLSTEEDPTEHGKALSSQTKMILDYSQMLFAKQIKEIMASDNSMLKTCREYLAEMKELESIEREFEESNYPPYIKFGHSRLLRLNGHRFLSTREFPFICAIVFHSMTTTPPQNKKKRGPPSPKLQIKVNKKVLRRVQYLAAEQFPTLALQSMKL